MVDISGIVGIHCRPSYRGTNGAEQGSSLEYLSGQHYQPQADQAVDDEVLQVVPPRPEHLLLVGVTQGAHQSRPYGRHLSLDVVQSLV